MAVTSQDMGVDHHQNQAENGCGAHDFPVDVNDLIDPETGDGNPDQGDGEKEDDEDFEKIEREIGGASDQGAAGDCDPLAEIPGEEQSDDEGSDDDGLDGEGEREEGEVAAGN